MTDLDHPTPHILVIPKVRITFKPFRGAPVEFTTDSSCHVMRRLHQAARWAERVIELTAGNRHLDAESRSSLNSYLRTWRCGRGARFPFHRQDYSTVSTRYQWEVFCRYLDFTYLP